MPTEADHSLIPGWGSDRDHANRPAYPRERMPARLEGLHWEDPPPQQPQEVEVLHSTERPGLTPVFGTPQPPQGLSGQLRRVAFRYTENDLRHWLLLLLADRVNVGEGLIDDLSRGHVPRIYSEMGGRAELRHNPAGAARKAIGLIALGGFACWLMRPKPRRRHLPPPR